MTMCANNAMKITAANTSVYVSSVTFKGTELLHFPLKSYPTLILPHYAV